MEQNCCCTTSVKRIPGEGKPWVTGRISTPCGDVCIVSSRWNRADTIATIRCRIGGLRMRYTVEPGLYGIGLPDATSPVFVSANYKLSFDHLRRALDGCDGWILVLDTKGINVWCAAGKGTFGTEELIHRIETSGLAKVVEHRRVIVPQLGAPGIAAHEVKKNTGFSVVYGPVRAVDIPHFLSSGMKATEPMRQVRFGIGERLILTPMELRPSLAMFIPTTLISLAVIGLEQTGILFSPMLRNGLPLVAAAFIALITGTVVTPTLLPWIPFRAFSLKGFIIGCVAMGIYLPLSGITNPLLQVFCFAFFPAYSSFCALNFTGSTPYTGMSGVKREMKFAVPLYVVAAAAGAILLLSFKLQQLFFSGEPV